MHEISCYSTWLQGKPDAQHGEIHRDTEQAATLSTICSH